MIKIALKHWIYELAINQIFNGIKKNFDTSKNFKKFYLENFKIGDRFGLIEKNNFSMDRNLIYYNCKIVDKCVKDFSYFKQEYIEIICCYIENTIISNGITDTYKVAGNIIQQIDIEDIVRVEK